MLNFFMKLFLACCFLLSLAYGQPDGRIPGASNFWYNYTIDYQSAGFGQVSYEVRAQEQCVLKKQVKYKVLDVPEKEEISAVLDTDYSLRSAYISIQQQQEQKSFVIITVSDRTMIQKPDGVVTLANKKFYLDTSDFLKSLVAKVKLSFGKMWQADVLSTDRKSIIRAKARYLGQQSMAIHVTEIPCHILEVTTPELKHFWAKAYLNLAGDLIGYELGSFRVTWVPQEYALEISQPSTSLSEPVIFDLDLIEEMILECDTPELLSNRDYQQIQGNQVILTMAKLVDPKISWEKISGVPMQYLQPYAMLPSNHPLILQYAQQIRYGSSTPFATAQKIAQWVEENLDTKKTPAGQKLGLFLGLPKALPAVAQVVLCRACGIPSRLVAGLQYRPGKFVYSTWAEVYLGQWLPMLDGKIGAGAGLVGIYSDVTWASKEPPKMRIKIKSIRKQGQPIMLDNPQSYFSIMQDRIQDRLLGLNLVRPADWILLPKSSDSDILTLRSIQGQGPAIILRVFELKKPLDEFLQGLGEKIGAGSSIEVLWQQARSFSNGKAMEVALQDPSHQVVYRAFLGQAGNKAVLALLIVPMNELAQVEPGFQQLIGSLSFLP